MCARGSEPHVDIDVEAPWRRSTLQELQKTKDRFFGTELSQAANQKSARKAAPVPPAGAVVAPVDCIASRDDQHLLIFFPSVCSFPFSAPANNMDFIMKAP